MESGPPTTPIDRGTKDILRPATVEDIRTYNIWVSA